MVEFKAALAPQFRQLNVFPSKCNVTRWTCFYMKLSEGEWSWASKCVVGTIEEIRSSWATSLMSPMDGEFIKGERHETPPREWSICQDDDQSREWTVLIQLITDRWPESTVVAPHVTSMTGTIREVQAKYPRSIVWPRS